MKSLVPYRLLDRPAIYQAAQRTLAPGAERTLPQEIGEIFANLPGGTPLLDIGCGPESWLSRIGAAPIGLDLSPEYVAAYRANGGNGVVASADRLPFADSAFAGVWSIGVLHHLTDGLAAETAKEAVRVCRPGGYVAILDAVLPVSTWRRPLARAIRALDRGRFMRREPQLRAILPRQTDWHFSRFTYSATGLEMLCCRFRKPA